MKKLASILLALMLLCTALVPAVAEEAVYASTAAFMQTLDENNMIYTYEGVNDSGNEVLIIPMEDDEQGFSFNVTMFFTGDLENATLYVWNLINYDPAYVYEVAYACNQCNYNSTYMKFYADETDNTVTAERWVIFRDHDVAEIVGEAFGGLLKEIENFYSVLAPYAV